MSSASVSWPASPCPECGFEYTTDEAELAGPAIVDGAAALAALIADGSSGVRTRPSPTTWSPLEYACHLRDVLLVQRERVLLARRQDRPSFDPMGRDERVEHDSYATQDPAGVARQLQDGALMFANVLTRLGPADWERTVVYNYPASSERPLRWVAVHTMHEVTHHLRDVQRQIG